MRIDKEPRPTQMGGQENLDFRSEEEKMGDLRAKIVQERLTGNFSFDLLNEEEKRLYSKLMAEDRESDQPKFRGH